MLALIYRQKGELPKSRAELYKLATEGLFKKWRNFDINYSDLINLLSLLAKHIHENHSTGLVPEMEMIEIFIAQFKRLYPQKMNKTI
jgi:predicted NACHT family NTPase